MPVLVQGGYQTEDKSYQVCNLFYSETEDCKIDYLHLIETLSKILVYKNLRASEFELYIYTGETVEQFRESINTDFPERSVRS
jgi:hypothetical protein